MLPGMDGITFAKRLRANSDTRNIPIIMLTAKSDEDNKIPLLIKADLSVGSLKATLVEFKNLKNSFKIVVD